MFTRCNALWRLCCQQGAAHIGQGNQFGTHQALLNPSKTPHKS
jgi:hypothetical protein